MKMKKLIIALMIVSMTGCETDLNGIDNDEIQFVSCNQLNNEPRQNSFVGDNGTVDLSAAPIKTRSAGSFKSVKDGDWNDPTTWDQGQVPSQSDNVIVKHTVHFPSQNSSQSYEHFGNITVKKNDGVLNLQSTSGGISGQPFTVTGGHLVVQGVLTTNEDLILNDTTAVFSPHSMTTIGDDLILSNGSQLTNSSVACGDFSIGDDIYLIGTSVKIKGAGTMLLGQSVNATPSTPRRKLADHISGQQGAKLSQITTPYTYNCGALPVTFTSFDGKWQDQTVKLTWATASEINNSGFEVMQVKPCQPFNSAEVVSNLIQSQGEFGASYSFSVPVQTGGIHYFQIKQTDYDGGTQFSDIISVKVGY